MLAAREAHFLSPTTTMSLFTCAPSNYRTEHSPSTSRPSRGPCPSGKSHAAKAFYEDGRGLRTSNQAAQGRSYADLRRPEDSVSTGL